MQPDDLFAVLGMGGMFLTLILLVLTTHQRKMAQFLNQRPAQPLQDSPELRREVYELKQLLNQQAIAIDNLAAQNERLTRALQQDNDLREHLQQSG